MYTNTNTNTGTQAQAQRPHMDEHGALTATAFRTAYDDSNGPVMRISNALANADRERRALCRAAQYRANAERRAEQERTRRERSERREQERAEQARANETPLFMWALDYDSARNAVRAEQARAAQVEQGRALSEQEQAYMLETARARAAHEQEQAEQRARALSEQATRFRCVTLADCIRYAVYAVCNGNAQRAAVTVCGDMRALWDMRAAAAVHMVYPNRAITMDAVYDCEQAVWLWLLERVNRQHADTEEHAVPCFPVRAAIGKRGTYTARLCAIKERGERTATRAERRDGVRPEQRAVIVHTTRNGARCGWIETADGLRVPLYPRGAYALINGYIAQHIGHRHGANGAHTDMSYDSMLESIIARESLETQGNDGTRPYVGEQWTYTMNGAEQRADTANRLCVLSRMAVFTDTERAVLRCMARGMTQAETARALRRGENAVSRAVAHIRAVWAAYGERCERNAERVRAAYDEYQYSGEQAATRALSEQEQAEQAERNAHAAHTAYRPRVYTHTAVVPVYGTPRAVRFKAAREQRVPFATRPIAYADSGENSYLCAEC